mmetsp:Transcript_25470/g.73508  ORF Transcript_25470/g.73508 Transcript_25470/m.73508 type:complete len:320 (+) Transcript_25470:62-1021(+)
MSSPRQEPQGPQGPQEEAPERAEEGYGTLIVPDALKQQPKRRRGRALAQHAPPALLALLLPWIVFMIDFAATTFQLHYYAPSTCWFIVFLSVLVLVACLGFTVHATLRARDATWWGLLSSLMLVAVVAGACLGTINFRLNLKPYFETRALNTYDKVDPNATLGRQMMDAGQVFFVPDAAPDGSKAAGFKNLRMYCVAPITLPGIIPATGNYDFWAVGTNCCSGAPNDFHCMDRDEAHAGLRVIDKDEEPFFRLAVEQAEAAHNLKAPAPVLLRWLKDPNEELKAYANDGRQYYTLGVFVHLAVQLVIVGITLVVLVSMS